MIEQPFSNLYRVADGLFYLISLLLLAKELFAHKEHSNAKPIPFDIFMMPVARADLFAILNRIAA